MNPSAPMKQTSASPSRGLAWAAVTILCGLALGCSLDGGGSASVPVPGAAEDVYRVSADATGFFHDGPQQVSGPDLSLKKDTRVVMIKRGFGYSQVRTSDGQAGYVGTSDITALSAEEIASERAQLAASQAASTGRRNPAIVGEYTIPPEAGSREKLPEPEVKPTPNPAMFRY